MAVVSFQDLPITDEETFDPGGRGRAAIEDDILGDSDSPDWAKFKKAHLWFDPDNQDKKAGYKFIIARMVNGRLTVIWRQLVAAVAILNGGRGGTNIPAADKRGAFNHAMRYYAKKGVKPADRPSFTGSAKPLSVFTLSIDLLKSLNIDELDDSPKWVHVANEGDYPGYNNGRQPFSLTRRDFEDVVRNFHSNLSYVAGDDGVGTIGIVQWDFHHACEFSPVEGEIPRIGAPAQAWVYELEIRNSPDGEVQLWALTEFLEPAKTYIREKKYKWASLAVTFNYIDPATAKNIGTYLTSIALTNQPIIQGMTQLVASRVRRQNDDAEMSVRYYGEPARSPQDAMDEMRRLFGLGETADVSALVGELAKLQSWATSADAPVGVDVDSLVADMRRILNLPALSTALEVLDEASKIVARLVDEQLINQGQPAAPTASASESAAKTAAAAKAKEKDMELLKTLATALGVRESDADVKAAVDDLLSMRDGIKRTLSADRDTTKVLLEAAEKTASAREKLTALVTALGVEDAESAVDRVAELLAQSKALTEAMPELENLRARAVQHEEEAAEKEVDEAMASRQYAPEMRDALLLFRKTEPDKFKERYLAKSAPPMPKPADDVLTRSLVATPSGVEIRQPAPAPTPSQTVNLSEGKTIQIGSDVINLAEYPGRNITERAIAYIRASVKGADEWSYDDVFLAARELKRRPNVVEIMT